jgi:parallel beta-helix repeat protein
MNTLRITLNNRKRFVISAALAAAFVLLAGGANALATTNTVRCVPTASLNPNCTAATTYPTISAALAAPAVLGDVIVVGPGKYPESVTISIPGLSLFGAQAGNDAREDRHDPTKESVVDGTVPGNAPFIVTAPYVVIDGFTVQGGTAGTYPAGIDILAADGTQVLNNIVRNNSAGVYLSGSEAVVIEHNLFKNNSAGTGSYVGYGVYALSSQYLILLR